MLPLPINLELHPLDGKTRVRMVERGIMRPGRPEAQ